jgi:hypothetical protein
MVAFDSHAVQDAIHFQISAHHQPSPLEGPRQTLFWGPRGLRPIRDDSAQLASGRDRPGPLPAARTRSYRTCPMPLRRALHDLFHCRELRD